MSQRLVPAAASPGPTSLSPVASGEDEARVIGAEAAAAAELAVARCADAFGTSAAEARAKLQELSPGEHERLLKVRASEVQWRDLDTLGRGNPADAVACWERVKQHTLRELRSGHRAGRALDVGGTHAIPRARFLAVRAELAEAWRPRHAGEQHLVDMLAQHQIQLWHWQEMAAEYGKMADLSRAGSSSSTRHEPPRLDYAAALNQAVGLVERYQRLYLQALAMLQKRRRKVVVRRSRQEPVTVTVKPITFT